MDKIFESFDIALVDETVLIGRDTTVFSEIDPAKCRLYLSEYSVLKLNKLCLDSNKDASSSAKKTAGVVNQLIKEKKLGVIGKGNFPDLVSSLLGFLSFNYYKKNILIITNEETLAKNLLQVEPCFYAFGKKLAIASYQDAFVFYNLKNYDEIISLLPPNKVIAEEPKAPVDIPKPNPEVDVKPVEPKPEPAATPVNAPTTVLEKPEPPKEQPTPAVETPKEEKPVEVVPEEEPASKKGDKQVDSASNQTIVLSDDWKF